MQLTFAYQHINYSFQSEQPVDISLSLRNGTDNPNCYYADPVQFETIRSGDFIGDVAEGGSCNHKKIILTPHGNGTHTECYGHISADKEATIENCLQEYLFFAQVISVSPKPGNGTDQVITLQDVQQKMEAIKPEALIIRTLPNTESKRTRQYSGTNPPYLESLLTAYLAEVLEVKHLIIDLPSVDKEIDGGLLIAHKTFWQYPAHTRKHCTITELAYIPEHVEDNYYLLNLQILNIHLDASPSKPVLYKLEKLSTN